MEIVARVFNHEIKLKDIEYECLRCKKQATTENVKSALNRLIDRCLLYEQAIISGIIVTDIEYDNALLELIEEDEPLGLPSEAIQKLSARELETKLKRKLYIQKYIKSIYPKDVTAISPKLHELYEENKDIFLSVGSVKCSHILIRDGEDAERKANDIRASITSAEDFVRISISCSDCPSNATCGDLGWFPRGKMIPEIDEVAFNMNIGEISQPFKSAYGYHILMLTDKKEPACIPFEDIKDSLHARMRHIECEFIINKHILELRQIYADKIVIY